MHSATHQAIATVWRLESAKIVAGVARMVRRAVSMGFGPAAGLEIVDALQAEPALKAYLWLPSVRGDLLARPGRHDEARAEFIRAAALAGNARERQLLQERADQAGQPGTR